MVIHHGVDHGDQGLDPQSELELETQPHFPLYAFTTHSPNNDIWVVDSATLKRSFGHIFPVDLLGDCDAGSTAKRENVRLCCLVSVRRNVSVFSACDQEEQEFSVRLSDRETAVRESADTCRRDSRDRFFLFALMSNMYINPDVCSDAALFFLLIRFHSVPACLSS